jgi:hypothetical protein
VRFVIGNEGRSTGELGSPHRVDYEIPSAVSRAQPTSFFCPNMQIATDCRRLGNKLFWQSFQEPSDFDLVSTTTAEFTRPIDQYGFPRRAHRWGRFAGFVRLLFQLLAQTPNGDYDGDGYTNLQEYNVGTNSPAPSECHRWR